jgi:hypothetical protein
MQKPFILAKKTPLFMFRLLAQLGTTLFIILLAGIVVCYTIWGYFVWPWIRPDSIRSFLIFLAIWIGLCWLTSLFFRIMFRVFSPYFPRLFRFFQEREQRKTPLE